LLTSLSALFALQITLIVQAAGMSNPFRFAGALASAAAVFALQLGCSSASAERWQARQRGAMVVGQAAASYLPLLAFGIMWTGMTGFLAGSVLLLMPGWRAWVPFTAVALSMLAAAIVARPGAYDIALAVVGDLAVGIVVFGLSRLVALVRQADTMHQEIAQLAVIRERTRFSQDLHDLLGYSLSAIALKAELSRRTMVAKPELAREELADIVVFARQAVADVRLVANGYRAMSLVAEAGSAASLLAAAGILADIEIDCGALDETVDTVLATVLREAVTNLLRHSSARTCRLAASRAGECVTLVVANDGAPRSGVPHRDGGGLENLVARLEAVGGTLTIESRNGSFGLLATVPRAARKAPRRSAPPQGSASAQAAS
jgi:two-component system sensor histidine kinase DesK